MFTYARLAMGAGGVAVLIWLGMVLHSAGYDSAKAEQLEAYTSREQAAAKEYDKALATSNKKRRAALAELDKMRGRPPVVITNEQTTIIERNVCRGFDAEFIGLLDGT